MATLRQVVSEVIDSLGRPFDKMLYERVKSSIMNECVVWVRRSINKDGLDNLFKQSYVAEVSLVDSADNPIKDSSVKILRTDNKIHQPIRYDGDDPFTYVGSVTWDNSFIFIQPYQYKTFSKHPMTGKAILYSYLNGYIYIYNSTLIDQIGIEGIYVDPREVIESNENNLGLGLDDDMEFPFPADLIQLAKSNILKAELSGYDTTPNVEKSHVDTN